MTNMITIDCQTCPGRERYCGDCFVPVLGRMWLDAPTVPPRGEPVRGLDSDRILAGLDEPTELDARERSAVDVFLRAGLVDHREADMARAEVTTAGRGYAVG